jgi:hypothetical protein
MYHLKYPTKQNDPPPSPRETLPTMYDLPSENPEENGVDQFHSFQTVTKYRKRRFVREALKPI